MNADQRKKLRKLVSELETISCELEGHANDLENEDATLDDLVGNDKYPGKVVMLGGAVADVTSDVQSERDEEEAKFDNMPEGLQNSGKGGRAEEIMGYLDDAISKLDAVESALGDTESLRAGLVDEIEVIVCDLSEAIEHIENACDA